MLEGVLRGTVYGATECSSARTIEFEKMKKWPIFWDEVFNGDLG
jgi:hypothetical protein